MTLTASASYAKKVDVAENVRDPTCKASVSTPVDAYAGERQFTALELI